MLGFSLMSFGLLQCVTIKAVHTLFLYKNLFYKNVQAEINQSFKNILRTYPG